MMHDLTADDSSVVSSMSWEEDLGLELIKPNFLLHVFSPADFVF
jgi:hypothetical protein